MSARKRLSRRWFKIREWAYDVRWCIIAAILNRIATAEMRHAALLLGYDLAMGHGREGFLGHLHEHCTGNEIGFGVRYGDAAERDEAAEMMRLECALYGVRRLRYEVSVTMPAPPPARRPGTGAAQTALSVLEYHREGRLAGADTWDILDGVLSMCTAVLELRDDPSTWFPQDGGAS